MCSIEGFDPWKLHRVNPNTLCLRQVSSVSRWSRRGRKARIPRSIGSRIGGAPGNEMQIRDCEWRPNFERGRDFSTLREETLKRSDVRTKKREGGGRCETLECRGMIKSDLPSLPRGSSHFATSARRPLQERCIGKVQFRSAPLNRAGSFLVAERRSLPSRIVEIISTTLARNPA